MRGREKDNKGSNRGLRLKAATQTKGQNVNEDLRTMTRRLIDSSTQMESEQGGSPSWCIIRP